LLQAPSAFGNMSAAFINLGLGAAQEHGALGLGMEIHGWKMSPWRIMFMLGAVPAFLVLFIMRRLKEPERWQKASHGGRAGASLGSYSELFRVPVLRKHALLGLLLGCAGVIGLWSVGFFTMDLIRFVREKPVTLNVYSAELKQARSKEDQPRAAHLQTLIAAVKDPTVSLSPEAKSIKEELAGAVSGRLSRWPSFTSIAINAGAFFGMFGFGALAQRIGRKPTFAIALLAACVSTVAVFYYLEDLWQVWVMVPVMGFCQLSLFAGYAIYFPELFPTRLRSTGTSFCYNVGRFVAAFGPVVKAQLEKAFVNTSEPLRYAGCTMCVVFLLGLLALPFLPETKGRPLPE
jgi:MFS family permease